MSYAQDIDKALKAHGAWKQRLHDAASTGKSEISVERARADNQCEFGKWFYGLPQAVREGPMGAQVQRLHADFHAEAARILALALGGGDKNQTMAALSQQSAYTSISGQLALVLQRWKQQGG